MEIKKTSWLESFAETCQDIQEDTLLLEALSLYVFSNEESTGKNRADCFPQVFYRLCGYLSQHAADLYLLKQKLEG